MVAKKKEIKFEDALKKLEELAEKMAEENIPLEESIKMFQEGMELSSYCNSKLDEAEKKINMIKMNSEGKLIETEFTQEEE